MSELFAMGERLLKGKDERKGVIVRCAIKGRPPSNASPRTPDKPAVPGFWLGGSGAEGDYNEYRSSVLKNTGARAVSIMTEDVLQQLQTERWPLLPGDLGENVLVAGVPYNFFSVGRSYLLGNSLVQITEPIAPCSNLCRLPAISEAACLPLIKTLNRRRGWYGRVLSAGHVATGDAVAMA